MNEKKYLGAMLDCSRNAVLKVDGVKRYIDALKKMGYNMLMLYTEETYEVKNQPFFGYLRGRYSVEELKELVAYGEAQGVELIPCIQTLAHLNQIFRWPVYRDVHDIDDILMIGEEKTYALIEDMFATLRECFTTRKIHIGMDEAHNVGMGNYYTKNGPTDRFQLLSRHLNRVAELAKKYDFEPLMWSDMFFRLACGGQYYTMDPSVITEDTARLVPENVELVYWDYYADDKAVYDNMLEAHAHFGKPVWFAGGAWMWTGFTPHNAMSMTRSRLAMASCREKGVDQIVITCWGDDGGEASPFSVLPALYYAAEIYRGNEDMDAIRRGFFDLFGIAFDDFMTLDLPSVIQDSGKVSAENPDKFMLYSDPFLGALDPTAAQVPDAPAAFAAHRDRLAALSDAPGFGYLFSTAAALCDVLEKKYALGLRTREVYAAGKEGIPALLDEYRAAVDRLDRFIELFRAEWLHEKKGHGFDVQDIRLGGLKQRLLSCMDRLQRYADGEIDTIEELDEELLPLRAGFSLNGWKRTASPNVI